MSRHSSPLLWASESVGRASEGGGGIRGPPSNTCDFGDPHTPPGASESRGTLSRIVAPVDSRSDPDSGPVIGSRRPLTGTSPPGGPRRARALSRVPVVIFGLISASRLTFLGDTFFAFTCGLFIFFFFFFPHCFR